MKEWRKNEYCVEWCDADDEGIFYITQYRNGRMTMIAHTDREEKARWEFNNLVAQAESWIKRGVS